MNGRQLAKLHEEWIANQYGGNRSRTSGASPVDKGDVSTDTHLYECKLRGVPGGPSMRTTHMKWMEKVADEAWADGKQPALCLRYYCPESPLAAHDGWVDFTLKLTRDDSGN